MKRYITVLFVLIFAFLYITGCSGVKETAIEMLSQTENIRPSTVVISEAMSDNTRFVKCDDGKYYDWIELKNNSQTEVVLTNCFLSDDVNEADKWLIPDLTIDAGEYAIIYMSDRNCVDGEELHASFKLSSDGESIMLFSSDFTELARLDIPPSEENLSYGISDDGITCGWYSQPTPMEANSGTFSETVEGLNIGKIDVIINEYMIDNTKILYDSDGDYSDWIELYNCTDDDIVLDGYSLCDSSDLDGKWYFPQGTVIHAGEYMLIFCSGKDKTDSKGYMHTSFRLSAADDAIVLLTPLGYVNSYAGVLELNKNVSAVLVDEGQYMRCSLPTPGKINNTSVY